MAQAEQVIRRYRRARSAFTLEHNLRIWQPQVVGGSLCSDALPLHYSAVALMILGILLSCLTRLDRRIVGVTVTPRGSQKTQPSGTPTDLPMWDCTKRSFTANRRTSDTTPSGQ